MIDIKIGDCLEILKTIPSESIHCCVTSPPYFHLRKYTDDPKEIGLEKTPEEYISKLVDVFREVKRILRKDGTLWLNIADSYSGGGKGGDPKQSKGDNSASATAPSYRGIPSKNLLGIPWRLALALQADGWILRSDIIWSKACPMPESVTDRPTKSHEYVFLLAKSQRYFYDAEAIKEPCTTDEKSTSSMSFGATEGKLNSKEMAHTNNVGKKWEFSKTRNKRDVWNLNPEPYKGSHFATFPLSLVNLCLSAGTSEIGCCPACGAPYKRIIEKEFVPQQELKKGSNKGLDASDNRGNVERGMTCTKTVKWVPTCSCNAGSPVPCTVLDPFAGSGTVGQWCRFHGREAVLIELNQEYKKMIDERVMKNIPEITEW